MRLDERFQPRAVVWFLRVFGLALIADVLSEIISGVWGVHAGRLYPWRHIGIVPLTPPALLAVEWTLRAGSGLALATAANRARIVAASVRIAALVLFVAVLQRYSNHGVLLFLVAFYLTIAPPDVSAAGSSFEEAAHPALGLVRAQLVIVYVFSALNKLAHGFGRGHSLANLLAMPPGPARLLSWVVIVTELVLPVVLFFRPRAGIALVVAMHGVFTVLVPGVASFSLVMVAMSLLFVGFRSTSRSSSSGCRTAST
jgi:hypothetical protein